MWAMVGILEGLRMERAIGLGLRLVEDDAGREWLFVGDGGFVAAGERDGERFELGGREEY